MCKESPRNFNEKEINFINKMHLLWEQHVEWTRMTIISMAEDIEDVNLVTNRLLRNPTDFANLLAGFYGIEKATQFETMLREHLLIAAELINAAKKNDSEGVKNAEIKWYENANEIAAFLHEINPFLSEVTMREMLHEHLALTESEAVYRLNKNYAKDIEIYDKVEEQALEMADEMARATMKQFPDKFICKES